MGERRELEREKKAETGREDVRMREGKRKGVIERAGKSERGRGRDKEE